MTVVNQTITLQPYNGGTVSALENNMVWCKLSDTRMVVAYVQTTPFARRFAIIDNPSGISSADAPSVFNNIGATGDTVPARYANSALRMERINATTFMVGWTESGSYAVNMDVFTVSGTTITRAWTGSFSTPNYFQYPVLTRFQQSICTANTVDNTVWMFYPSLYQDSTGGWSNYTFYKTNIQTTKMIWDPTAKVLSFPNSYIIYQAMDTQYGGGYYISYDSSGINTFYRPDFYTVPIPGSTDVAVGWRMIGVLNGATSRGSSTLSQWFVRASTASISGYSQLPNTVDFTMLSGGRRVNASWKAATYYGDVTGSAFYDSGTPTVDDGTTFPFVLGLAPDYHAVVDSRHFMDPTKPFQIKIARRADSNIIETNPASQGKQYGVTVNIPVKIRCSWDKNRPFVQAGDIMWCGAVVGQTDQFAYNILKQPSLPSS